ncbi:MAG: ATP-binding cassette domain-containing protein [Ilumatobacteraceae bacterium]
MNGADRTVVAGERAAKAWPGTSGLRPLDFELVAGEVVALRGRSGSGKSTLIALLAGWCAPTGGLLRRSAESDPTSWSGTAVVPQTLGLLPELSIAENVALPARLARRPAADLDGLLGELDLDTLRSRLPAEVLARSAAANGGGAGAHVADGVAPRRRADEPSGSRPRRPRDAGGPSCRRPRRRS